MGESVRQRILFTGRVQGVGFRQTTCLIARHHAVTGYVRNLPDGRVEAVVEGESAAIDSFRAAVVDEMRGFIRDVRSESGEASGEFEGFRVRY
ncbi:MAG: acylphosphatase [Phycisphaerae bacterium]|nr:acylphosphatase [Phycisphaerae bacterium]